METYCISNPQDIPFIGRPLINLFETEEAMLDNLHSIRYSKEQSVKGQTSIDWDIIYYGLRKDIPPSLMNLLRRSDINNYLIGDLYVSYPDREFLVIITEPMYDSEWNRISYGS